MPKRIYSADEYLKGLEAQGIVVHDAMRTMVKRMNGQGILEGYPAVDDASNPLLPPGDARYEAGHAEKMKEAQERIDAFHVVEAEAARQAKAAQDREFQSTLAMQNNADAQLAAATGAFIMPSGRWEPYSRQAEAEKILGMAALIQIHLTRSELAALIQHLAASGHSAQRVAELAGLLV